MKLFVEKFPKIILGENFFFARKKGSCEVKFCVGVLR